MSGQEEYDFSGSVHHLTMEALNPENIVAGKCFLCGGEATDGKGEHVFPRWLQGRHDLSDLRLSLLNGTLLPYRNLRVPACVDCNSNLLGKTENFVSKLNGSDVADWSVVHSYEVGRWLSKILVGILFKEANLLMDRANPDLGVIYPPEALQEFHLLHLLVQSWRKLILFSTLHTEHPFTLYVYQIEQDSEFSDFDVSTNLYGKSLCMRFGSLGFAFVGDGGLQHHAGNLGPYGLGFQKLHPVQFDEIAARVHYKAALRDATHSYFHSEEPDVLRFQQMSVVPYTATKLEDGSDRVFRDWCYRELAIIIERYRVPGWEYLLDDTGGAVYTRLVDESGKKLELPVGGWASEDR